jgi:hypothetical protein
MTMTGVKLFQILKTKIGEREADALITYVDNSLNDSNQDIHAKMLSTFATKVELFATKTELKEEIGKVREDLAKVKGELEVKISDVKSDVVRWMFAFFVTMLFAILGLYLKK